MVIGPRSILLMSGECRRRWKFHITAIDADDDVSFRTITLRTNKIFDEEMLRRRRVIEPSDNMAVQIGRRLKELKEKRYSGNSGDTAKPSREELVMGVKEADLWEKEVLSVII